MNSLLVLAVLFTSASALGAEALAIDPVIRP